MKTRLVLVLTLLFIKLSSADSLNNKIERILSYGLYPSGKLITQKKVDNLDIISMSVLSVERKDSRFEEVSFILEDGEIIEKIKGVPVKISDKYIFFYDRYNFYRFTLSDGEVLKEKRLKADFFKRIHRKNLIVIDGNEIYIKGKKLIKKTNSGEITLTELDIPDYYGTNVLNFHYCEGDLLGIFELRDSTVFYLIDVNTGKIKKKLKFPFEEKVGFYACIDNKILVYKQGLRFLTWDKTYYELPEYTIKAKRPVIKKLASISNFKTSSNKEPKVKLLPQKELKYVLIDSLDRVGKNKVFKIDGHQVPYYVQNENIRVYDVRGNLIKNISLEILGQTEKWLIDDYLFIRKFEPLGIIKKCKGSKWCLLEGECIYRYSLKDSTSEKVLCYREYPEKEFHKKIPYKDQRIEISPTILPDRYFFIIYPGKYCVMPSFQGGCTRHKRFEGYIYILDNKKKTLFSKRLDKKDKVLGKLRFLPFGVLYLSNKDRKLYVVNPDGKIEELYKFDTKIDRISISFPEYAPYLILFNTEKEKAALNVPLKKLITFDRCSSYNSLAVCTGRNLVIKSVIDFYTGNKLSIRHRKIKSFPICAIDNYIFFYKEIYSPKISNIEKILIPVYSVKEDRLVDTLIIEFKGKHRDFVCYGKYLFEIIKGGRFEEKEINIYKVISRSSTDFQ